MKRIIMSVVLCMLVLSFAGCKDDTGTAGATKETKQTQSTQQTQENQDKLDNQEGTTDDGNTYIEAEMPLTITCKPSGEYGVTDYNGIQYWQVVYFEEYRYSHTDVFVLFATKEEAAYYAEIREEELCDNGYIVKLTSENGSWDKMTREEVIENSDKYRNSTDIKIEDGVNNPNDRFDEIKEEYKLQ